MLEYCQIMPEKSDRKPEFHGKYSRFRVIEFAQNM